MWQHCYLNGVLRTVLGVCICCRWGVTPLKSLSCSGVLRPPFRGVSMLVRAIRFWASWKSRQTQVVNKVSRKFLTRHRFVCRVPTTVWLSPAVSCPEQLGYVGSGAPLPWCWWRYILTGGPKRPSFHFRSPPLLGGQPRWRRPVWRLPPAQHHWSTTDVKSNINKNMIW